MSYDNPERLEFCKAQRKTYPDQPRVYPDTNIPAWVRMGVNVCIHQGVFFTDGFGYARDENGDWLHIPHVGGIVIGDDVDIYPGTTINRGTAEDNITTIGPGTKIDHHCHIGHNSTIGENCVICAGVIVCGSAIIGNNVWIGPGSIIKNKVYIADNVYIGCASNVVSDITISNSLVYGNPARVQRNGPLPHNKLG